MRFREFATPARPVLKISQQAQARASANTPATPLPTNTPPTTKPAEPIRVYPRQWQRAWLQKYLAAQMARSAQTIKPTADDMALAFFRYGEAQSRADADYERTDGVPTNPDRRAKRDQ
jgi:hypothetical protein